MRLAYYPISFYFDNSCEHGLTWYLAEIIEQKKVLWTLAEAISLFAPPLGCCPACSALNAT